MYSLLNHTLHGLKAHTLPTLLRRYCGMAPIAVRKSLIANPIQKFEEDIRITSDYQVAAWVIPHDDKVAYGGEDTYFISGGGSVFGVFDGVGGWASSGVNPRNYSYSLMKNCLEVANNGEAEAADCGKQLNPLNVLIEGYNKTIKVIGSCTATVGSIRLDNDSLFLDAVNLGDSGLMILKSVYSAETNKDALEVALRSEEQQHAFNFPYQLGPESSDKPKSAHTYSAKLDYGDIIIFGTDGLWDNTYDRDIVDLLKNSEQDSAQSIAKKIATASYNFAADNNRLSPFAKNARVAWRDRSLCGGKQDDITVLVVKIQKSVRNFADQQQQAKL